MGAGNPSPADRLVSSSSSSGATRSNIPSMMPKKNLPCKSTASSFSTSSSSIFPESTVQFLDIASNPSDDVVSEQGCVDSSSNTVSPGPEEPPSNVLESLTTVVIGNLHPKCTLQCLLNMWPNGTSSSVTAMPYVLVYLPVSFRRRRSRRNAFVNFLRHCDARGLSRRTTASRSRRSSSKCSGLTFRAWTPTSSASCTAACHGGTPGASTSVRGRPEGGFQVIHPGGLRN